MDVTKIITWLPFNESVTQDLLGNTWTAVGSLAIEDGALKLDGSSSYLAMDGGITLGGQDFTIRCQACMNSGTESYGRLFEFKVGDSNSQRFEVTRYNGSGNLQFCINPGSESLSHTSNLSLTGKIFDLELDYMHSTSTWRLFVDGQLALTHTMALPSTTFKYPWIGCGKHGGGQWQGTISQFMILDGVALHSENFTPPTAEDYTDWQLAVAGYAPAKISFDVETYLRNAQKGWRVYNPGEAELLDTKGATTVKVPYTQSVTGKAFYGGTLSDMFHTPAGLKEIWIRFDAVHVNISNDYFGVKCYAGHYSHSQGQIMGMSRRVNSGLSSYGGDVVRLIDSSVAYIGKNQMNKYLLHIKSHATDGLIELTMDKNTYKTTGNINNGEDLDNIVFWTLDGITYFSNVVVSETELTLDDGWHRDSFGVETKINAPVLNVRLQGSNVKFPLSTKRKSNSLTIRVGDKNFYNTSVATDSTLAGAARYLLDDKARALSTATT